MRFGPYFHRCGARIEMPFSPHRRLHSASPKNVLGPIRAARAPDRIPSNRKMFIDLYGVRSIAGYTLPTTGRMFLDLSRRCLSPQPHSVNLKNVHRPIRSSPHHWSQAGHRMNVPGPIRLQVTSRSNSVNLGNEIAFLIGAVQEIWSRNVQAAGRRPKQDEAR